MEKHFNPLSIIAFSTQWIKIFGLIPFVCGRLSRSCIHLVPGWLQLVSFPTRKNNTLDVLPTIPTNRPALFQNSEPIPGSGDRDTAALADIFCHPQRHKPVQRKIYCLNKANINDLKTKVANIMYRTYAKYIRIG